MPDSGGKILSEKEIASCFFKSVWGIRTIFMRAVKKESLYRSQRQGMFFKPGNRFTRKNVAAGNLVCCRSCGMDAMAAGDLGFAGLMGIEVFQC